MGINCVQIIVCKKHFLRLWNWFWRTDFSTHWHCLCPEIFSDPPWVMFLLGLVFLQSHIMHIFLWQQSSCNCLFTHLSSQTMSFVRAVTSIIICIPSYFWHIRYLRCHILWGQDRKYTISDEQQFIAQWYKNK